MKRGGRSHHREGVRMKREKNDNEKEVRRKGSREEGGGM